MKMLPLHSLVLTSTAYPARQVMQSDAEGPVQPLQDWWQAAETEKNIYLYLDFNNVFSFAVVNTTTSVVQEKGPINGCVCVCVC